MNVDLSLWKNGKIELNDLILLSAIEAQDQIVFEKINHTNPKYVKQIDDNPLLVTSWSLRGEATNLFANPKSTLFDEFWELFPTIALGLNGDKRPLRAVTKDSENYKTARKLYLTKVKTPEKHSHVVACLKAEVKYRTDTGSEKYMNNILTWIRQSNWEKYAFLLDQDVRQKRSITI